MQKNDARRLTRNLGMAVWYLSNDKIPSVDYRLAGATDMRSVPECQGIDARGRTQQAAAGQLRKSVLPRGRPAPST